MTKKQKKMLCRIIVTAVLVVLLSVGSFVLWRMVSRKNAGSRPETRS